MSQFQVVVNKSTIFIMPITEETKKRIDNNLIGRFYKKFGIKIVDDVQYADIYSSPKLLKLCARKFFVRDMQPSDPNTITVTIL